MSMIKKDSWLKLLFMALALGIVTVSATTAGWDKMTDTCKSRLFPVTSGGKKEETVSCTFHDTKNDLLIMAGTSDSEDYVPNSSKHAYAYAVDLEGNWVWGQYFLNGTSQFDSITGCHFDNNGTGVFLGLGQAIPIIFELNLTSGKVIKFMNLEMVGTVVSVQQPTYLTYGAIMHDKKDPDDGLSYYYVSFLIDLQDAASQVQNMMQILKINSVTYEIQWNYQYFDKASADASVTDATQKYKNRNKPNFMYEDPNDRTRAYLVGQTTQLGTIIKFAKRNMQVDYRMEIVDPNGLAAPISPINEITAYKQVRNQIFACGYSYDTPNDADTPAVAPALPKDTSSASIFQMTERGVVNHLYSFGKYQDATSTQHDVCRGVTYDAIND